MKIEFKLANSSDEELLSRIQEDPDYNGPPMVLTSTMEGFFEVSAQSEVVEVAAWFAGYHDIKFTELTFNGANLLQLYASEIAAAR